MFNLNIEGFDGDLIEKQIKENIFEYTEGTIELECPMCKEKFETKLKKVVKCPNGHEIEIEPEFE